ncbi:MAG: pentapeptide repeat-containing protein [Neomegalonema sp.]|nr:pentapeptide repeat-containing protein [Neomegalonema sp.]
MAQPVEQIYTQGVAHSYAENIKHSRTNFFVLLIAQLYCLITIETTQDAALLSNATTQKLPILETTIGIETFYIIAPLLLLVIFVHFQLHLKSFFSSMVQAARHEGRDPVQLVDNYPWFITSSMTRRYAAGVKNDSGFASWFEYAAGLIFGWYSTALVCFMFWARYLAVHDWTITIYHAALTSLAFAAAVYFLNASKSGLRGLQVSGWRIIPRGFAVLVGFTIPFCGLLYGTWWMFEAQDKNGCPREPSAIGKTKCGALFLLRSRLELAGINPAAALDGADLSTRLKAGWFPSAAPTLEELQFVRGASLPGVDLRYASARDALLIRADLSKSKLRRATFDGASLHGAILSGADLSFSSFVGAKFDHAVLGGARMEDSDFTQASLRHTNFAGVKTLRMVALEADFSNATLLGCEFEEPDLRRSVWTKAKAESCTFKTAQFDFAKLDGATMRSVKFLDRTSMGKVSANGADFQGAVFEDLQAVGAKFRSADFFKTTITGGRFRRADFSRAIFSDAKITGANMIEVSLRGADFRGAALTDVDLRKADLREIKFGRTIFKGVKLAGADLVDADFSGADLSTVIGLTQKQLNRACGDARTKLPVGLTLKTCGAS